MFVINLVLFPGNLLWNKYFCLIMFFFEMYKFWIVISYENLRFIIKEKQLIKIHFQYTPNCHLTQEGYE